MGNSQSDHSASPRITTSSQPFYNNKDHLHLDGTNTPLNFNILKAITLAFLKTYSEEHPFQYYHNGLKKFIEDYDYQRFSGFLGDFSDAVLDDAYTKESFLSTASNSPSAVDLDQGLCIPFKSAEHGKIRPSLDINRQLFSNTLVKSRDLTERVERFLQTETAKKTNFFFEFAHAFGELFAARYQTDLRNFEKAFNSTKPRSAHQQQTLKEDIKFKYEQARQEIRHFQNIIVYTLRSFVVQAHSNLTESTTFSMKKAFFERQSMKLLFGKNQCYPVYFELVKYYVRDDEAALRKSMNELKTLRPEDFKVDERFCMKESEAPYENVVECLNYLDVYTSPYDKFEAIAHMNKEMTKEIRKSWENSADYGKEQGMLELSAEKLIPINCYCLVQSGNANMKRHQVFMDDFINKDLMNFGDEAYYYITFVASASFLINVAENPMKKLRQL